MSQPLVDVRCPLPSMRKPNEKCNKLCVRVQPGSSGKAYCSRHDAEFNFQVDDFNSFDAKLQTEKPTQSA